MAIRRISNGSGLALHRAAGSVSYRGLIFARLSGGGNRSTNVSRRSALISISGSSGLPPRDSSHARRSPDHLCRNWKFQMENGVDGYHGNYVHSSFIRIADRAGERKAAAFTAVPCRRLRDRPGPRRRLDRRPDGGMAGQFDYGDPRNHEYHAALRQAYGDARLPGILAQRNILIFPNLFLFESHIRVMQPLSVSETIVTMLPTLLDGVPDAMNEARLRAHERFFGPAGFGTPDDVEMFVNCENGVRGRAVEWVRQDRGLHRETADAGRRVAHSSDETPQRSAYRQWRAVMQRQPSSGPPVSLDLRAAEAFLFQEARLLDDGRFDDWLGLFAPECLYWLPILDTTPTGAVDHQGRSRPAGRKDLPAE